jgi:hypothetical protein
VTVALPREWAEELMRSLMTSLEMGGDEVDAEVGMDDPDLDMGMDMDADADLDMDGPMDLGLDDEPGDEPDFAAGDDDSEDEPAPKKRGPGRPPGKSKPKKDDDKKKKPSDDDDDEKDETVDFSRGPADGFSPGNALGESAFHRAARVIARRRPR